MNADFQLEPYHWEVLSLEESNNKLLFAETVRRGEFERVLRAKLESVEGSREG